MISTLFHAQNAEPGCRLGKKFGSPYHRRAWSFQVAAGNLRRHREEELINKTGRHKLSEQRGTSLVKEETHALCRAQKLEYCGRSHEEIRVVENGDFGRVEPIDTRSNEPVAAFQSGHDLDVDAGGSEGRTFQIHHTTCAHNHRARIRRLAEHGLAIDLVGFAALGYMYSGIHK